MQTALYLKHILGILVLFFLVTSVDMYTYINIYANIYADTDIFTVQ